MKLLNLTLLSEKYGGGYVARMKKSKKVVAYEKQLDLLMKKIQNMKEFKEKKLIISWVPEHDATYVFFIPVSVR